MSTLYPPDKDYAEPCLTWRTSLGASAAGVLAEDLRSTPDPPPGPYSCPADDGSFVQVWFATDEGRFSYRVGLAGCRFELPAAGKLSDFGTWPEGVRQRGPVQESTITRPS